MLTCCLSQFGGIYVLEAVNTDIRNGDYLYAAFGFVLLCIFNLKSIMHFIGERRRQKVSVLIEAAQSSHTTDKLKIHFENEILLEYFRLNCGVKIGLSKINALLNVKELLSDLVPFHIIVSSRKYINTRCDCALHSIQISPFDYALAVINFLFVIILFLLLWSIKLNGSISDIPSVLVIAMQIAFCLYGLYQIGCACFLKHLLRR